MLGRLTRLHLSILVAFSALAGYLFHPADPEWRAGILLGLGVWSLSAGASALNQAQEKEVDARMMRTRTRPLVTGQLSVSAGIFVAILFLGSGLTMLALTGESMVLLLGLFALVWYNLVYTLLKKVTPFAVLPGALCGALPILMGWVLSGGGVLDYPILMLCSIVVLWQVPHFWLLALAYPEDVRRSGLPNLFTRIRPGRLRHLSLVWIVALLAGVGFANFSGVIRADLGRIAVAIAMLLLGGALVRYQRSGPEPADSGRLFVQLNLFMTLLFVAVAVDRFAAKGDAFVSIISALG